jgi:hypothetical protein
MNVMLLAFTIDPDPFLSFGFAFAMIAVASIVLAKLLGIEWLRGLFESEGQPSARILAAVVVVGFCLFMVAAKRIDHDTLNALLLFAGACFGFGTGKVIASRFAARPQAPGANIKANKAEVTANSATVTTPPNG